MEDKNKSHKKKYKELEKHIKSIFWVTGFHNDLKENITFYVLDKKTVTIKIQCWIVSVLIFNSIISLFLYVAI